MNLGYRTFESRLSTCSVMSAGVLLCGDQRNEVAVNSARLEIPSEGSAHGGIADDVEQLDDVGSAAQV